MRLAVTICFAVLVGCSPAELRSPIRHLEARFPTLQRLQVATIWDNDECTYFAYGRGVFSIDPADIGCWVYGNADAQVFDDQARQDFDAVRAEFAGGSDPIDFAGVWYQSDGAIKEGSYFQFNRCVTYVYWPGYTGPGDIDEDAKFIPLDEDWYAVSICG